MSILFHLKKFVDPKNAEEKQDQENSSRQDDLMGMAEGEGPQVDVPEATQPTYVCQHCGFTSEKKNYCGDCLTFMEVARD